MDNPKKKKGKSKLKQLKLGSDKFLIKVFACLYDLRMKRGLPLHAPTIRQELYYKFGLRKCQSSFVIRLMTSKGMLIMGKSKGYFLNEYLERQLSR
jgi:hypothetical protein